MAQSKHLRYVFMETDGFYLSVSTIHFKGKLCEFRKVFFISCAEPTRYDYTFKAGANGFSDQINDNMT